jgi:hypothetical protein
VTLDSSKKQTKILLVFLPFWTPQIPPLGISCLKGFLEKQGFQVKTVDANIEEQFKDIDNRYFERLLEQVPADKRGNFYNVGQDVLRNHLMAFLNYENEKEYQELIIDIIYKTFYVVVDAPLVMELHRLLSEFYQRLETYFFGLLDKERPSVLGLSVNRGNLPAALFAFKGTRERYPDIKTVMGGPVFSQYLEIGTPDFEYFLEKTGDYIDKIFIGEGEGLFLKWLKGELPQEQRVYTLKDIGNEMLDLSSVETPDFSDLELRFYPNLATYSSRSCPFQCSFCSETVYWGRYRKRPAKQIATELVTLYQRHRSQLFLLGDSLLNPVIDNLAGELIDTGVSIYWDGYLRVDKASCDIKKTMFWRRGGFYRARLGIESGSPQVLELMGKKISLAHIRLTAAALAEAGIKTTTYWVIGHPGETEADFQQTLDLVEELKDDIYEAWCSPFQYFLNGQVQSAQWATNSFSLYPPAAKKLLITQTWTLDVEPTRQEAFQRMNRFVEHCKRLGVPNPFSLEDIYNADQRWKKLHRNAVPSIVAFENRDVYIDENKTVKELIDAPAEIPDDGDFGF